MSHHTLDLDLIAEARKVLSGKISRTPLVYSFAMSKALNTPVYLKMESLQITGSFKLRGALFTLSTLTEEEKRRGVATCSAGNHGLGVAYAAKQLGVNCTVYVPKSVDKIKKEKIEALGARVITSSFDGYDETLNWTKESVQKTGEYLISAFEDARIMAANGGTLASEILEEIPDVENILFPVGGGGMGAGIALYSKAKNPPIRLIGCQHIGSPGLKLSLERGKAVTVLPSIETLAGGLEGGIGETCFEILKTRIDEVRLLTEKEIWEGCLWMLKHEQFLIEPAAAVTIAACLTKPVKGKTVVVLSGRNVAYSALQKMMGLV